MKKILIFLFLFGVNLLSAQQLVQTVLKESFEVKEIINRLMNAGEIQEKDVRVKATGRPMKRIVAIDPNFFDD
jgi:hypothetical protein